MDTDTATNVPANNSRPDRRRTLEEDVILLNVRPPRVAMVDQWLTKDETPRQGCHPTPKFDEPPAGRRRSSGNWYLSALCIEKRQ